MTKRKVVITLAFRGFRYYCSEAFKSMWYNKLMAFTSVVTVMGCLLLFGFFTVLGLNINHMTRQVESQCEVHAFLPMDATDKQEKATFEKIKTLESVNEVTFVTREEAYEDYKEILGVKSVALSGLDPKEFLPASCRIVPKDVAAVEALCQEIEAIEGVDEVVTQMDTIDGIVKATSFLRHGCIICTILLAIIAVFIITNTIKLDIHARAKEIHIMKYVGATDWFIRWPFIIEGILVGIIGGIVSLSLLCAALTYVLGATSEYFGALSLLTLSQMRPVLIAVLIIFGAVIGALGSAIAVRKHLKV